MTYQKLKDQNINYYIIENYAPIYSALNCPIRKPTGINTCFCKEPIKNSIWPQCKKYKGKSNMCMEAVCCKSCDINQQNKCPF